MNCFPLEKEKSLAKLQQELERERQRNRLFSGQDKQYVISLYKENMIIPRS